MIFLRILQSVVAIVWKQHVSECLDSVEQEVLVQFLVQGCCELCVAPSMEEALSNRYPRRKSQCRPLVSSVNANKKRKLTEHDGAAISAQQQKLERKAGATRRQARPREWCEEREWREEGVK